jgi:prepilin-type N-terminal cleavage/methylation domain-containing protein
MAKCFTIPPFDRNLYGTVPAMKTKGLKTNGFTFIEIMVALTIVVLLTTLATSTIYDVVHTLINKNSQYLNMQYIMAVHRAVAQAKLSYATDLAIELASELAATPPTPTPEAQLEITRWNNWASQNDNFHLIDRLINPDPNLPNLPLNPLTPGSRSYLPTYNTVQVTINYQNGNPVIKTFTTQITDMDSLLRAFVLTDNGQPEGGNVIATISVGTMLDLTTGTRPTLPIVDWKSGTLQEIQF